MQGIEILTTTQVATDFVFNLTVFWWVLGVLTVVGLIFGLIDSEPIGGIITGIVVGLIIGVMMGVLSEKPTDYETHYKVTISEEVLMTDFFRHYEVIEQDGKIFTVREKDNNE